MRTSAAGTPTISRIRPFSNPPFGTVVADARRRTQQDSSFISAVPLLPADAAHLMGEHFSGLTQIFCNRAVTCRRQFANQWVRALKAPTDFGRPRGNRGGLATGGGRDRVLGFPSAKVLAGCNGKRNQVNDNKYKAIFILAWRITSNRVRQLVDRWNVLGYGNQKRHQRANPPVCWRCVIKMVLPCPPSLCFCDWSHGRGSRRTASGWLCNRIESGDLIKS